MYKYLTIFVQNQKKDKTEKTLYPMASPEWTPFYPKTGHPYNALSCGSCLMTRSSLLSTSEVIQIPDSPSPLKATTVFATPKFALFNHTHGAEQLHQAAVTHTKKESQESTPGFTISASTAFFLLI